MNESRVIFRNCAVCGEEIEIKLSGKDHWWQKRKILEGGYYFFTLNKRERNRIVSKGEMVNDHLIFISIHPWWKRNVLCLYWWSEDKLDPPEKIEYWECKECYEKDDKDEVSN